MGSPDRISLLINAAKRLRTVRNAREQFLFLWAMQDKPQHGRIRRLSDLHRHRNIQRPRRSDDDL
jgi:hypothetical protein